MRRFQTLTGRAHEPCLSNVPEFWSGAQPPLAVQA
jgi:hypothetical protein